MSDHVAARPGLEVDHELLHADAADDRLFCPLLRAGEVPHGPEGVDDQRELDDQEQDDDPPRDQDPCSQAEAHHQILSGTWQS